MNVGVGAISDCKSRRQRRGQFGQSLKRDCHPSASFTARRGTEETLVFCIVSGRMGGSEGILIRAVFLPTEAERFCT
jgi:hypothetical protein